MPTYEYETIPRNKSEAPVRFEVFQRMADAPLKKHPESGERVRRVISGGISVMRKGGSSGSSCCSGGPCCR